MRFFWGEGILWVIKLRTPGLYFGAVGAEIQLVLKMSSDRTGYQRFFVAVRKEFHSVCF
jgi:hypothetical protein